MNTGRALMVCVSDRRCRPACRHFGHKCIQPVWRSLFWRMRASRVVGCRVSHSHTTAPVKPMAVSAAVARASRGTFASNFCNQNAAFLLGAVVLLHHRDDARNSRARGSPIGAVDWRYPGSQADLDCLCGSACRGSEAPPAPATPVSCHDAVCQPCVVRHQLTSKDPRVRDAALAALVLLGDTAHLARTLRRML